MYVVYPTHHFLLCTVDPTHHFLFCIVGQEVMGVVYVCGLLSLSAGSASPILQLIRGLVQLSHGSVASSQCVSDVSRCLGEIGPVDLGCIAIPTRGHGAYLKDAFNCGY